MFHKLKNYIQSGIIWLTLLPSVVLAAEKDPDPYGLQGTAGNAGLTNDKAVPTPLPQLIGNYISIFLSLLGVIFLVLMLIGGFRWMKARGKSEEVEKAKEIITDAVIGLVIVAASYAITAFVIDNLTKK